MKLALINDTHFGVRGDSKIFLNHQEKFFREIFFPTVDKEEIKVILDLGDTFDRRKFINFETLKRSKNMFFDELAKRNIKYHAIVGNHSVYYKNTNEVNSMDLLLGEYDDVHVYHNDPVELKFDSLKILMVPWITKTNSEVCYKSISESKASIVLGHFSIKGFEMMKGRVSDHGMDKELFSNYDSVYSGHFHHPSEYGNIKYLGAQYEMNWSDYNGKRGFHILDTETRDLTWVENPYKIFYKIDYDDEDMTVEDIAELDTSMFSDTFIKVVVKNRTNAYIHDLFLEKLSDSGAADVKSIDDSLNLSTADVGELLDESQDTRDVLKTYVESIDTQLDRSKILSVVDELYSEALNIS